MLEERLASHRNGQACGAATIFGYSGELLYQEDLQRLQKEAILNAVFTAPPEAKGYTPLRSQQLAF